jgi:hypothetical protein
MERKINRWSVEKQKDINDFPLYSDYLLHMLLYACLTYNALSSKSPFTSLTASLSHHTLSLFNLNIDT